LFGDGEKDGGRREITWGAGDISYQKVKLCAVKGGAGRISTALTVNRVCREMCSDVRKSEG
jgi:hypothetical protein